MTTAKDVAGWMAAKFKAKGELHQADAASAIRSTFGEQFTYENENGNLAIAKPVLREFKRLTPEAIWDRWAFGWCRREKGESGRKRG